MNPTRQPGAAPSPLARRPAFSLVELMIATVILGFGLLMIGAVLPIAWKSSLDNSAHTRASAAASLAKFAVQGKCLVDSRRDLFDNTAAVRNDTLLPPDTVPDLDDNASYALLGDWDTADLVDDNGDGAADLDAAGLPLVRPRVHALHLENWALSDSSRFLPANPPPQTLNRTVPEAPLLIEFYPDTLIDNRAVGMPAQVALAGSDPILSRVGAAVVSLRERVFPPLPETLTPEDPQWEELLRGQTFAWSAFHLLTRVPRSPGDVRNFLFYYVTLRRGPASRFARQDFNTLVPLAAPRALPDSDDVLFPIAWRVPLLIVESQSSGVPSVAFAGVESQDLPVLPSISPSLAAGQAALAPLANASCKVAAMLPRGSAFIDEQSGIVYRVTQREYLQDGDGGTDELARLTLDKDVRPADLAVDPALELTNGALNGAGALRRNRVIWVFPPSVEPGSRNPADGGVRFSGPNPVVEIRVEPLTLRP